MRFVQLVRTGLLLTLVMGWTAAKPARGDGDLKKVKHVLVIMQENHSFDSYFGALAYAPGSPYHSGLFGCRREDQDCVDGLICVPDKDGGLHCYNANPDDNGTLVSAFHDTRRCAAPDLDHSWLGTHEEMNFLHPNSTLRSALSDGFVRVNDKTEQIDNGVENPTDDQTMGFYTQDDIPFYYNLASQFCGQRPLFRSGSWSHVSEPLLPACRNFFRAPDDQRHVSSGGRLQTDHWNHL
jgi:phospholipase C